MTNLVIYKDEIVVVCPDSVDYETNREATSERLARWRGSPRGC